MSYSLIIGSFNVQELNYRNIKKIDHITPEAERTRKIARIINEEHFDIVALQAVTHPDSLELMCNYLPGNWKSAYSTPLNEKYGRAFIWNEDFIRLSNKEPVIQTGYKLPDDSYSKLTYAPFAGKFTPDKLGGPAIEVCLINTYLKAKDNLNNKNREITKREFRTLADSVYPDMLVPDINDKMFRPRFVIALGDYNLVLKACRKLTANDDFNTVQGDSTTLSNIFECYANDYDHFSYQKSNLEGFKIKVERVDAAVKYCKSFEEYRKTVSDHVPVKMILTF